MQNMGNRSINICSSMVEWLPSKQLIGVRFPAYVIINFLILRHKQARRPLASPLASYTSIRLHTSTPFTAHPAILDCLTLHVLDVLEAAHGVVPRFIAGKQA